MGAGFAQRRTRRQTALTRHTAYAKQTRDCTPDRRCGILKALQQKGRPLRIAVLARTFAGEAACADAREAITRTTTLLTGMGHHIEETAPQFDFEALQKAVFDILIGNLAVTVDHFLHQRGRPADEDEL